MPGCPGAAYLQGSPALPQLLLDVFLRRIPCSLLHLHPLPQGEDVAAKSQGKVGKGCLGGRRAHRWDTGQREGHGPLSPQHSQSSFSMSPSGAVLRAISSCLSPALIRLWAAPRRCHGP